MKYAFLFQADCAAGISIKSFILKKNCLSEKMNSILKRSSLKTSIRVIIAFTIIFLASIDALPKSSDHVMI